MIAIDTNILVYAHRKDSPFHETAARRLRELAEGRVNWAIPWPCLHEFLSVVTHPRVYQQATPLLKALDQVEVWLASPNVVTLAETSEYFETLSGLLIDGHIAGPRVHDARVAALCLEHGVRELWSADRDFNRFAGFRVVNPLLLPN